MHFDFRVNMNTLIGKQVVLAETHLILHEGLLALRLLQNVPTTSRLENLRKDPVMKWMFSELDLLQAAFLVHLRPGV